MISQQRSANFGGLVAPSSRMVNVLFLREPSDDGPDRYHEVFRTAGYNPISVPVLETSFTNLNALGHIIEEGPTPRGLNGVVITSKRSCEAWGEALNLLQEKVQLSVGGDVLEATQPRVGWYIRSALIPCI